MGAAAGKQMHSEKAKHAAAVLNAVQSFDENHAEENDSDLNKDPELFKRRVLLAAAEAKLNGNDIENSLAQLSDADLVSLCQYVENQKEEDANKSASMKIEEIVDEDNNAGTDNIDETTSVLSYGDDEVPDNESENDESGTGFGRVAVAGIGGGTSGKNHSISSLAHVSKDENDIMSSGDEIDEHADSDGMLPSLSRNPSRVSSAAMRRGSNGVRVFPMGAAPTSATKRPPSHSLSRGALRSRERPSPSAQIALEEKLMFEDEEDVTPRTPKQQQTPSVVPTSSHYYQSSLSANKHLHNSSAAVHSPLGLILPPSMAEKYSRIWEPEPLDNGPLTATSMAFDSPTVNNMHGASPGYKYKFNIQSGGTPGRPAVYKDIGERIDERNDALMGLQRQKVISYTQNAQLEREVEALQRQLEKMDQLDGTLSSSSALKKMGSSSGSTTSAGRSPLSSAVTHSVVRTGAGQGSGGNFSHIYPIDEESRSLRRDNQRGLSVDSDAKHSHNGFNVAHLDRKANNSGAPVRSHHNKHHKHGSSSSSDTDNSSVSYVQHQQQQPQHAIQRFPMDSSLAAQEKAFKSNGAMQAKRSGDIKAEHSGDLSFQSDYVPTAAMHHSSPPPSSSFGTVKAKQHIPAPRRRVRNGANVSSNGSNVYNGNSSGFDSDDSTNSAARHPAKNSVRGEGRAKEALSHPPQDELQQHVNVRNSGDRGRVGGGLEHSGESAHSSGKHKKTSSGSHQEELFRRAAPSTAAASEDESDHGSPVGHLKNFRGSNKADARVSVRHRRLTSEETTAGNEADGSSASHVSPPRHSVGKGTALKNLNKRRHSMDGSGDEHGLPHEESSASQDEDARRQKMHEGGNKGGGKVKDVSPLRGFSDDLVTHGLSGSKHANSPSASTATHSESRIPAPNSKLAGRRRISGGAGESSSTAASGNHKDHVAAAQVVVAIADHSPAVEVVAVPVVAEKRRRGRLPSMTSKNVDAPPAVIEIAVNDGPPPLWSPALDNSWAEVSLLLRKPIKAESDMQYTVAAAEAGIIFIEQMDTISKAIQVQRGALSRWLLPYDNNTRIDMQCSTPHSVVENMPDEFRGKLTERQVHYLVGGANGVRQLVRIKIADDNDLEQARTALLTTDRFFKLLYHVAEGAKTQPYQLLQANY